ncbi:unnamed protein product [Pseudo-nitzschia multistriata]|uniref:Uncharacterized protein n=1 Tax=Pseudo-nitzschia multistriata TaxID=183589 RepID=A0A448ZTL6_9STRA|nr:unnamed protein product [Pseudo-nitzschia multistriata]
MRRTPIASALSGKSRTGNGKKGSRSIDNKNGSAASQTSVCKFCARNPPALLVQLPVLGRKKRAATPYCLSCYYTTSAVRQDPEKYVTIFDEEEKAKQLPAIQNLFSECFLELQHELSEESVRAFKKQKSDPLAMLSFSSGSSSSSFASKKRRKLASNKGQAPDPRTKQEGRANDGGFLREIDLPERLKRTQKQQEELQNQQLARMNQAASAARRASRIASPLTKSTMNKRRKGSGKSIWNLAMDKGKDGKLSTSSESYQAAAMDPATMNVSCTCGSKDVRSFGNITSRNQDVRKGEIWGTDRGDEVINRFQCNICGRTWNEAE